MKRKVLIVDDDMNFRYAMREMIPWSENDYEVAAEAIHGKQALEILEQKDIQIVFTDMDMPVMNGVRLTEEIKKSYPEILIVALSAYDDFGFVKESMRLGASDYILKQDFDGEKIIEVLDKICQEHLNEREAEISLRRSDPKFLLYLKNGTAEKYEDLPESHELRDKKRMLLFLCRSEKSPSIQGQTDGSLLYIQGTEKKEWLMIYQVPQYSRISEVKSFQEQMILQIRSSFSNDVWIGCSDEVGDYEQLPILYRHAWEALQYAVYFPQNQIYRYYDFEERYKARDRKFVYQVKDIDWRSCIEDIEKALLKNLPEDLCLNESLLAVYRKYHKKSVENGEIYFYEEIKNLFFFYEKIGYLKQILQKESDSWEMLEKAKHPEIRKALKYINDYYAKDISLGELAVYVGLSENYFSNLFKQEMGENLTVYINKVRIENAKKLLEDSSMKVYEIAEAVGFRNATYLSTMFKKITGSSISEYKSQR